MDDPKMLADQPRPTSEEYGGGEDYVTNLFAGDLAYTISDIIVSCRPASMQMEGFHQYLNPLGGVLLSWKSRGAEIHFAINNDGEVQGFVGNDDRHFIWQVDDYSEIWDATLSVLREYQRW